MVHSANGRRMLAQALLCPHRAGKAGVIILRDDKYLNDLLEGLLEINFRGVPLPNPIDLTFGQAWQGRLGLIILGNGVSFIRINSLLQLDKAPFFAVTVTLAHELVHYAHGFGSSLPRKYPHPHKGGIVDKELRGRGLGHLLPLYKEWCLKHWNSFYEDHAWISANGHATT